MKKLVFILLFLMLASTTIAQQFVSLVDSNAVWSDLAASGYPPNYNSMVSTWVRFGEDTTINGKHYFRIFKSLDLQHQSWSENGYIRDDSIGRVYRLSAGTSTEELLYDFSLNVGDTFHCFSVTNISFISINGVLRKQLHFSASSETWIEGLGCSAGVLNNYPDFITGGDFDLLCYYYNDSLLYSSQKYPQCYYSIYLGRELPDSDGLEIFPNPASSVLHIRYNKPIQNEMLMNVFDIHGSLVFSTSIPVNCSIYHQDISGFANGIYFLQLTSQEFTSNNRIVIYK